MQVNLILINVLQMSLGHLSSETWMLFKALNWKLPKEGMLHDVFMFWSQSYVIDSVYHVIFLVIFMIYKMEGDYFEEMDLEVLSSMWPEDLRNEAGKQFNIEKPGVDQDMLDEITIVEEPSIVDFKRLLELTSYSEKGSSQLAYLVKQWEYKQANAVRLLHEEINILSQQREEVERKKLEILEAHRFEEDKHAGDKRPISILDEVYDIWEAIPRRKNDVILHNKKLEIDAEYDTIKYWKQRAMQLDKLLEASIRREQTLQEKLQDITNNMERQSSPVEELSQILKRADNFLHFILQNAPVVIGHQVILTPMFQVPKRL